MAKDITTLLDRIERDLMKAAGFLEERGFDKQTDLLDKAADHVESVRDALDSLKEVA